MSVLVCDSNGELWYTRCKDLGVDFISMPYLIGGQEYYYDLGEKTDFKKFYNDVKNGEIPKTMALNPDDYKEFFTPYFEKGEDVIYVSFSHAMSGTFNQLDKALAELKEIYPERTCTVFNTNSISLGAGIHTEAVAKLKNEGATDEEVLAFLKTFTNRINLFFAVDDLMHLKRGGRLSGFSAVAGTVLGIKPILSVDEKGALKVLEKVKGRRTVIKTLADKVIKRLTGTEYPVYVIHADCEEDGQTLVDAIKEARPEADVRLQMVGPVIGSHCGAGTIGVIFVGDERPVPLEGAND